MKKEIKIKCWVAITEDNEFMVGATKKEAKRHQYEFKNFDIEAKIKKAILIINS